MGHTSASLIGNHGNVLKAKSTNLLQEGIYTIPTIKSTVISSANVQKITDIVMLMDAV